MTEGVYTITALPPQIKQYFSRTLLSQPYPHFSSKSLDALFKYARYLIGKKLNIDTKAWLECESIVKQYLEFYERIVEKEKEPETKNSYAFKTPFYSPEPPLAKGENISWRFRAQRRANAYKYRNNNEV